MKSKTIAAAVGMSLCLLCACKSDVQNTEAVKQGVMTYLAKRSDLLAMDVSVTSVAFRQNEATASVHFQAKGTSAPGSGMSMDYVLERKGSQWVVKGRAGSGASHGAEAGGMPQNGGGSLGAMPQTMPPGHPSVSPSPDAPKLPPGHPAIQPGQKPPGQDK